MIAAAMPEIRTRKLADTPRILITTPHKFEFVPIKMKSTLWAAARKREDQQQE